MNKNLDNSICVYVYVFAQEKLEHCKMIFQHLLN